VRSGGGGDVRMRRPRLRVAVDWDGTLVGPEQEWLPGAREALRTMLARNCAVVVHTCRANYAAGAAAVRAGLDEAGFVAVDVKGKEEADVYVDDRALRFEGSWPAALDELTTRQVREQRRRASGASERRVKR
jgi:hypothetical protein